MRGIVITVTHLQDGFNPACCGKTKVAVPKADKFIGWLKEHDWTELESTDTEVKLQHNNAIVAKLRLKECGFKPRFSNGKEAWRLEEENH